ncbi:sulfatase-like hydrolase/transferase, partial [Candidatus Latescibacterota bacterium]
CDYALDFMERNSNESFFLYYPMMLTHCPCWPTPDSSVWVDPGKRKPGDGYFGDSRYFGDMVSYMDKIVGRIIDKLDALKIRENTIVLFIGDNGSDKFVESWLNDTIIKGGKGLMTDAGTHVPFIVNWPGSTPAGVCDDLVDFSDFMPTFAYLAGTGVPQDRVIDGVSFSPRIVGEEGTPREWVFCHYWGKNGREKSTARESARDKRWKLYDDGTMYDLESDRLELSPLDTSNEQIREVEKRLREVFLKVHDNS